MSNLPLYGLVGSDISSSLSPFIHEKSAEILGLSIHYELFEFAPSSSFGDVLRVLNQRSISGLNITAPFKEAAAKSLESKIHSLNTLKWDGKHQYWEGYSTDGRGLETALFHAGFKLQNFSAVIIIGNGGAAKSFLDHCSIDSDRFRGSKFFVVGRQKKSWDRLFPLIQLQELGWSVRELQDICSSSLPPGGRVLCIQASSLPGDGSDALQEFEGIDEFLPLACILDMNYKSKIKVWERAASRGVAVQNGLGMLVAQALESQKIWWEKAADYRDIFRCFI